MSSPARAWKRVPACAAFAPSLPDRRASPLPQNLLIITAIKADKTRVKDYIHRLDNFDGPAVGEIAVGYEMFEEAFEIYKKFGLKVMAIKVRLQGFGHVDRALLGSVVAIKLRSIYGSKLICEALRR